MHTSTNTHFFWLQANISDVLLHSFGESTIQKNLFVVLVVLVNLALANVDEN